jgi:hypothetical protein
MSNLQAVKERFQTLLSNSGFGSYEKVTVSSVNVIVLFPKQHTQKAEALKVLLASAGYTDAKTYFSYDDVRKKQMIGVTAKV